MGHEDDDNQSATLEERISSEENITINKFRENVAETLKSLSKLTESSSNGKNGSVQPMRSK